MKTNRILRRAILSAATPAAAFARTWFFATRALPRILSILAAAAVSLTSVNAQTAIPKSKPAIERYAHHDIKPRDGWDDAWQKKHPAHTADKSADPDGDGISNWEEMLDGTDPAKANAKGRITATADDLARQAAAAAQVQARKEQEWPAKAAELQKMLAVSFDGKGPDPERIRNDGTAQKQAVDQSKTDSLARFPVVEKSLDNIAIKYGIPRSGTNANGKGWTLVGESPNGPLLMTTQNARAANSINADDLWPTGLHTWQNSALTRNLTGSGITTAIFEAGSTAGILTSHQELSGRAVQVDSVTAGDHATAVADVIAGSGLLDVFRNNDNQGKMLRGVAYQSNVRGYGIDFGSFPANLATAVSEGQRFSNHSYGLTGGWYVDLFTVGGTPTWLWVWPNPSFPEDPRFGMYSSSIPTGVSSRDLDSFVHSSLVQLPVYAAGNPNNTGPVALPSPFYVIYVNGLPTASTAARDWVNGDDGGYDSVLSPATAKNVLTVGSILDVTGSTVYLSYFSGTGPTDDGRIKPDVVAVGQRNSALGQGNSLFLARTGSNAAYYDGVNADSQGLIDIAGTSFAAPQATGALALAQQRREQLFPGAGPLLASTWRALVVHTATELGAYGPDYLYGWGMLDAVGIVKAIEDDQAAGRGTLIKEFEVSQGQPQSFYISLPANTAGRFTLAWSDPAGNPAPSDTVVDSQTAMLINDLNLVVEEFISGTSHHPWILNPDLTNETQAARSAPATKGVDSRNNIERIDIDASAQERLMRVKIAPQGTITSGPQKVSLIISGATPAAPVPADAAFTGNPSNANEMALTFNTDPNAFFTLQTSTELMNGTWSDVAGSTVMAASHLTAVLVNRNPAEGGRFWRLRRGQ